MLKLLSESLKNSKSFVSFNRITSKWYYGLTDAVTIRKSSDGGHGADNAMDLFVASLLLQVNVLACQCRICLRVQSSERRHSADQHAHGVSIEAETLHHPRKILMDEGMTHDPS